MLVGVWQLSSIGMPTVLNEVGSVVHQKEERIDGAGTGDAAEHVIEEPVSHEVIAWRDVNVGDEVDGRVARDAEAAAIFELEPASLRGAGNRLEAGTASRREEHVHCALISREPACHGGIGVEEPD